MKVIYYYHVPKCGGEFIFKNLKRMYEKTPNAILFNFYKDYFTDCPSIIENIPNLNYEHVYIYHHHGRHGLKDIISELKTAKKQVTDKGGEFYLFTCLRKTIPFVNSHVNYINEGVDLKMVGRVGAEPLRASLRQDVKFLNSLGFRDKWNFDTAINESWFNNYQSKYLLHNHVSSWREDIRLEKKNINEIIDIIDKIYVTEKLIKLKTDLQELVPKCWLFIDNEWYDKKVNISTKRLTMTEEQKSQLIDKNQFDIWLYNKIKND